MVHRKKALALGLFLVTGVMQGMLTPMPSPETTQLEQRQAYVYSQNESHPYDLLLLDGANRGDLPMVKTAIAQGADIYAVDYFGETATEIAGRIGYDGIVTYIKNFSLFHIFSQK